MTTGRQKRGKKIREASLSAMNLSVIVTTYNRPDALGKVLDALRDQSRPPDEVIVADDGSGPDTEVEISGRISGSPFLLHHVWQEDMGFRAAHIRNMAIRKASGDYIVLLDGDCIPSRRFLEDHLALAGAGFFIQGKRVLVSRRLSPGFFYGDANSLPRLFRYLLSGDISNSHHLIRMPMFPASLSRRMKGIKSCNMGLFRKDLIAVNGFNQDFVGWGREDSELAVRLYRYGLKRKEHPFMCACFHLWHVENDREKLETNDELLRETIESNEYFCSNGIVQKQGNQI